MLSNQDMIKLIADATNGNDDNSFKSMQELIRVIASCVGVDEDTGEVFLKVKEVEGNTVSQGLGFGLGTPQSTLVEQEDNGGDNDSLQD